MPEKDRPIYALFVALSPHPSLSNAAHLTEADGGFDRLGTVLADSFPILLARALIRIPPLDYDTPYRAISPWRAGNSISLRSCCRTADRLQQGA